MSDKGKEGNFIYYNFQNVLIRFVLSTLYHVLINTNIVIELIDFKARRVSTFNKNLLELAEWEIKHAQVNYTILILYNICTAINT